MAMVGTSAIIICGSRESDLAVSTELAQFGHNKLARHPAEGVRHGRIRLGQLELCVLSVHLEDLCRAAVRRRQRHRRWRGAPRFNRYAAGWQINVTHRHISLKGAVCSMRQHPARVIA